MSAANGATLVGKALKNEGVKAIFTLSGGPMVISVYNTCVDENIELIDMRHEQAAANAATGFAMATRGPGVAMVTSGPGVINMASGMAAAWYACAPVIGICGHTPYILEGKGAVQEFDPKSMYQNITKWRGYCTATHRIPEYIASAFRNATTGRKGPVLLEFSDDAILTNIKEQQVPILPPQRYRSTARPYGEPALVRKALGWLLKAKRPGILIGSGVFWSDASKDLVEFAELLNIPVCYAIGAKGCIPDNHTLCGGPVGYDFGAIAGADILLTIGVRFEEVLSYGSGDFYAPDVKVISVDIEPAEMGRNRPIDIGIWGDAKAVLAQLTEVAKEELRRHRRKRSDTEWVKSVKGVAQSVRDALLEGTSSPNKPIDPRRLGKEVCDFLGSSEKDSCIVMDGGDIHAHTTPLFNATFPGSYINAHGGSLGHLGGGIPFGIGIKTARPDMKVLVVVGDGSFLLNGSEIDTAVRHKKPIVVVVGNDGQWGMVRHCQELITCRDVCSKLSDDVRYDRYAKDLGAYGELVTEPEQIKPALKRAFASGIASVLDVRIEPAVMSFADYTEVSKATKAIEAAKEKYIT